MDSTNASSALPTWLGVTVCALFVIISIAAWLLTGSTLSRIIYYIIFFIPSLLCGEYLGEKIVPRMEELSTAKVGFSPLRILIGVCFVLVLFAFVYGLTSVIRQILG